MAVVTYSRGGQKASTSTQLDKKVFGLEVANHQLLKDVYLSYLANGRANLAAAKTRGQVQGGGQKPWRQKGTGRARFGSTRNPIWRGGGAAFGPTGRENYRKSISVKAKRQALRQALSLAAKADKLIIIETFDTDGKVKSTVKLLEKIGAKGSVLIAVSQKDELVERSTHNLSNIKAVHANYLTVFDVLNADSLVISKKSLEILSNWLGDRVGEKGDS